MQSVQTVPQRVNAGHEGRIVLRGELALTVAVIINSFAVALTVYAGLGISPVSSFPYAVSLVFPFLTLGTWTYLFQGRWSSR